MKGVTYSQVQDVVRSVPLNKLPEAYKFLLKLALGPDEGRKEGSLSRQTTRTLSYQDEFMTLPLAEQERLMAEQAARMVSYYEQTADEREIWLGGDIVEY
jgi:hypothetical protein